MSVKSLNTSNSNAHCVVQIDYPNHRFELSFQKQSLTVLEAMHISESIMEEQKEREAKVTTI
jgi:hypothetical protein